MQNCVSDGCFILCAWNLNEWHGLLLVHGDLVNIRDLLDCELCELSLDCSGKNLFRRNGPKQITGLLFNLRITVGGK